MSYITLIAVAIAGIILGYWLARRRRASGGAGKAKVDQSKVKRENKQKILDFLRENDKVTNDDAEGLLNVSNATAERYLNELEREGKLVQHGTVGINVFYTSK